MLSLDVPKLEKSIFKTDLQVRINDINYGNHLGHDSLISLLHEARVKFLNIMGYTELDVGGLGMIMKNIVVNYSSEAFHSDIITIDIAIHSTSRTGIQILYQATNKQNKKEIATALTTMIFFDYGKSKVSKIPEIFIKSINHLSYEI